jgi:hypothetical protein
MRNCSYDLDHTRPSVQTLPKALRARRTCIAIIFGMLVPARQGGELDKSLHKSAKGQPRCNLTKPRPDSETALLRHSPFCLCPPLIIDHLSQWRIFDPTNLSPPPCPATSSFSCLHLAPVTVNFQIPHILHYTCVYPTPLAFRSSSTSPICRLRENLTITLFHQWCRKQVRVISHSDFVCISSNHICVISVPKN